MSPHKRVRGGGGERKGEGCNRSGKSSPIVVMCWTREYYIWLVRNEKREGGGEEWFL